MDNETLALYIGAWMWKILSIILFISSFIFFAMPRTKISYVFFLGFLGIAFMSLYYSWKRQQEFYDAHQEEMTREFHEAQSQLNSQEQEESNSNSEVNNSESEE